MQQEIQNFHSKLMPFVVSHILVSKLINCHIFGDPERISQGSTGRFTSHDSNYWNCYL